MTVRRALVLLLAAALTLSVRSVPAQAVGFVHSGADGSALPLALTTGGVTLGGAVPLVYTLPQAAREQVIRSTDLSGAGDTRLTLTVETGLMAAAGELLDVNQLTIRAEPLMPLTVSASVSLVGVHCVTIDLPAAALLESGGVRVLIEPGETGVTIGGQAYRLGTPYVFDFIVGQDATPVSVRPQAQVFSGSDSLRPLAAPGDVLEVDYASIGKSGGYILRVDTGIAYTQNGPHAGSDAYAVTGLAVEKTPGVLLGGDRYVWEARVDADVLTQAFAGGRREATVVFSMTVPYVGGQAYAMMPCAFTFRLAQGAEAVKADGLGAGQAQAGTPAENGAAPQMEEAAQYAAQASQASQASLAPENTQSPDGSQPEPSATARIVGVNEYCNVRSGPGTNYPEVGRAYLDETVEVLERKGEWVRCYFNSRTLAGWIHQSFLGSP